MQGKDAVDVGFSQGGCRRSPRARGRSTSPPTELTSPIVCLSLSSLSLVFRFSFCSRLRLCRSLSISLSLSHSSSLTLLLSTYLARLLSLSLSFFFSVDLSLECRPSIRGLGYLALATFCFLVQSFLSFLFSSLVSCRATRWRSMRWCARWGKALLARRCSYGKRPRVS